jgi:hypothetical protein
METRSDTMQFVLKYWKLVSKNNLSDKELDFLDEILIYATEDPILEFWLAEIDHIIAHRLGLLDENSREFYEDSHSFLREYIGIDTMNHNRCVVQKHIESTSIEKRKL